MAVDAQPAAFNAASRWWCHTCQIELRRGPRPDEAEDCTQCWICGAVKAAVDRYRAAGVPLRFDERPVLEAIARWQWDRPQWRRLKRWGARAGGTALGRRLLGREAFARDGPFGLPAAAASTPDPRDVSGAGAAPGSTASGYAEHVSSGSWSSPVVAAPAEHQHADEQHAAPPPLQHAAQAMRAQRSASTETAGIKHPGVLVRLVCCSSFSCHYHICRLCIHTWYRNVARTATPHNDAVQHASFAHEHLHPFAFVGAAH